MNPTEIKKAKRKLNVALAKLSTHSPSTYYPTLPVAALAELANSLGFDGAAFDGVYTGHDGRASIVLGPTVTVTLSWHRMDSGNFELIAYAS